MDTEGNEQSCRQRVATDPDAGTLTVTYPARCTSTDDPKPRKDLMADPLHVGTTFEATFPGGRSIDAETADVALQRS